MSWSKSLVGSPAECGEVAKAAIPELQQHLPEYEKSQVEAAVAGMELALKTVPAEAKVNVSLSGHGHRNPEDGSGYGSIACNISYSVAATPTT